MKTPSKLLVCLLALGLFVGACGSDEPQAPAYKTFTSDEGKFSAQFPGTPKRDARTESAGDIDLNLVHFSVDNGDEAISVSFIDYPDAVSTQDPKLLLDSIAEGAASAADGTIQGAKSTLKSKTPTTVDGHEAIDFEVEIDERDLVARAILVGARMYLLQVVSEPEVTSTSYDKLTSTFKLI